MSREPFPPAAGYYELSEWPLILNPGDRLVVREANAEGVAKVSLERNSGDVIVELLVQLRWPSLPKPSLLAEDVDDLEEIFEGLQTKDGQDYVNSLVYWATDYGADLIKVLRGLL